MMLPLAAISMFWQAAIVLWMLVTSTLILVILIQKGRGGGLAGAFGGAGASSLMGAKTGDFLTWVTIGLVATFLILSVLMGLYMRPMQSEELASPAAQTAPASQPDQTGLPSPSAEPKPAAAAGNGATATQPATQPATAPQRPAAENPQPAPAGTPTK
jgi:preprotein translocase subunit SecG